MTENNMPMTNTELDLLSECHEIETGDWYAWIAARVEAGARWLDATDIDGLWWKEAIDFSTFDLVSCTDCVLGQVVAYANPWTPDDRHQDEDREGYRDLVIYGRPRDWGVAQRTLDVLGTERMSLDLAQARGFHFAQRSSEDPHRAEHIALTACWVGLVTARRMAAAAA